MASFRLPPTSLDSFYSNKSNFSTNPLHFPGNSTLFSISSCIHLITSLSRFSAVKVSRIETELSEKDPFLSTSEGLVSENEQKDLDSEHERKIKYKGAKKGTKREVGFKFSCKRNGSRLEREGFFVYDGELDVNYSVVGSNMSLEQCNDVLKRLEKGTSDDKTLRFFEWMRSNGKLEKNVSAFNVVFRVLGRREDWDTAERMIREMRESFGSELDCRVFNTLIYSCSKRGSVELSGKWFRMMLELGVQPNVATFGMVMGLYQKGWNVEEAEFSFAQMRSFGIICQSAYSAMITIYTRLSLYDKAEEVIGLMRDDKVVLNLENWLVLLNAYSQQGKLEKAEQLLVSMQEAKFSPTIVAYNILITGYGDRKSVV